METNQKFGKYKIRKFLGSGATSDVYLAYDTEIERDVALKILKPALISDQASFSRFKTEAKAAGKLFHDNIATVLDLGELDGYFYIAMRYIDGLSLCQLLKNNGKLKWEQVKKLTLQIGSAIVYAHAQGFIHRDIKPSNILVDKNGNFFLSDFGLTYVMQDSGVHSTISAAIGTPPYMPPEIWNGLGASVFSDQYSFACALNEAINGVSLFSAPTTQEIITRHLILPVIITPYPAEIPRNVNLIVQKALSKSPEDRFPDIKTFVDFMMTPSSFNPAPSLPEIKTDTSQLGSLKQPIMVQKSRNTKPVIVIVISLVVFFCIIAYLVTSSWIRGLLFTSYDFTPTPINFKSTYEQTPELTNTAESVVIVPSVTTQPLTILPTEEPFDILNDQVQLGSGVEINFLENGQTGLLVYLYQADGSPIEDEIVKVYSQKQDLSGH